MDPKERYDLKAGEWREDPPHIAYHADRSGLVRALTAERNARAWTEGEADRGPTISVHGRTLACPPSDDDVSWVRSHATPAPYGRGEDTVYDTDVRDARQIGAEHLALDGSDWTRLRNRMRGAAKRDLGLEDTEPQITALKLLIYEAGGHFSAHADTEKARGMVASAVLVLPGEHAGGALAIAHRDNDAHIARGGSTRWRWAVWYADCRHTLEPVTDGVRIALTFAITLDAAHTLKPEPMRFDLSDPIRMAVSDSVDIRSYADGHTRWARRDNRSIAGGHQYGEKTVLVLEHRYSEPGLTGALLKGNDRTIAKRLINDAGHEAVYLAWLQIREIGSAITDEGTLWGDPRLLGGYDMRPTIEDDDEPSPRHPERTSDEECEWLDPLFGDEPGVRRVVPIDTPRVHPEPIARQNIWVEALRELDGSPCDHGAIDVRDGEIAPAGALDTATPDGARLYEATGNEGASVELQYRRAALVVWRRNEATLRMLAECGGRLAIVREFMRKTGRYGAHDWHGSIGTLLALWPTARTTDGGDPAPEAHRLLLRALGEAAAPRNEEGTPWRRDRDRAHYLEYVAAHDLHPEAVPMLIDWLRYALESERPTQVWVRSVRRACARTGMGTPACGVPALLRAMNAQASLRPYALAALAGEPEPPANAEQLNAAIVDIEHAIATAAWRNRRSAGVTSDRPFARTAKAKR